MQLVRKTLGTLNVLYCHILLVLFLSEKLSLSYRTLFPLVNHSHAIPSFFHFPWYASLLIHSKSMVCTSYDMEGLLSYPLSLQERSVAKYFIL